MFLVLGYLLAGIFLSNVKMTEHNSGGSGSKAKQAQLEAEALRACKEIEPICSETDRLSK
jgi:hypothetical protein